MMQLKLIHADNAEIFPDRIEKKMTRLITMLALVFVASVASATPLKLPYLPNPEENYELGVQI